MTLKCIPVGKIVNAHGIRGEVRVLPEDNDPAFLTHFQTIYIDGQPITPVSCRVHKNFTLMKLPDVKDMNEALTLKGKVVFVSRSDVNFPKDIYLDSELLGISVYNGENGDYLGEITAVDSYPASKIYTVCGKEKTWLVPAVKDAFILSVDIEQQRMEIRVWEGLETDAK